MSFFGSGFCFPQPRPAVYFDPPDISKVYLHNGENAEDFQTTLQFLNYFHEMFKFFPDWEKEGYSTGTEGDLTEYKDGFGKYADPDNRGFFEKGKLGPGFEERYGDWHHVYYGGDVTLDGEGGMDLGSQYWGYGEGETGGNVNWDPSAYESDFFKDIQVKGADKPVNYTEYAKLMAYEAGDEAKFKEIYADELGAAKNFMKSFGDVSFYEFVMKGIDGLKFTDKDNNGIFELGKDEYDASACNFMWKGKEGADGKGAFYVMLNLLESRRRIYYAAASVFGPHRDISDSSKMIQNIDNFFDNKVGGADPHNFRLFYMYFAMQHAFRSAAQAFCGDSYLDGNLGGPGYVYSARDRAGFDAFAKWLNDGVGKYIQSLKDNKQDAEAGRVESLFNEFRLRNKAYASWEQGGDSAYDFKLPYGMSNWDTTQYDDLKYTGWDSFYGNFTQNEQSKAYKGIPANLNPLLIGKQYDGHHPNYAIAQLKGLGDDVIKGNVGLNYNGKTYNLYGTNWVVHLVGRLMGCEDYDTKKAVQAISLNMFEMNRADDEKKEYEKKEKEYKEKVKTEKAERAEDEKKREAQSARRKNEVQKARQKQQKLNQEQIEKMRQQTMLKVRRQFFSQMLEESEKKGRLSKSKKS